MLKPKSKLSKRSPDRKRHDEIQYRRELSAMIRTLHILVPEEAIDYATYLGIDHLECHREKTDPADIPTWRDLRRREQANKLFVMRKTLRYVTWLLRNEQLNVLPLSPVAPLSPFPLTPLTESFFGMVPVTAPIDQETIMELIHEMGLNHVELDPSVLPG